jgi:ABC-type sulfate transport system permease component
MILLLIGNVVCLFAWAAIWKQNLVLGFGVLIGVLLAWVLSYPIEPYVTGMKEIPVWLPPLPLATVAIVLFIYGALVWIRGSEGLPKVKQKDEHDSHH